MEEKPTVEEIEGFLNPKQVTKWHIIGSAGLLVFAVWFCGISVNLLMFRIIPVFYVIIVAVVILTALLFVNTWLFLKQRKKK